LALNVDPEPGWALHVTIRLLLPCLLLQAYIFVIVFHLGPVKLSIMTITFTTLPLEVRTEIYKSLFNIPRCKPPKTPGDKESQLPKKSKLPLYATILPYESLPSNPAVLGTCHQIYHEAVSSLYANRVFEGCVTENTYRDIRKYKICIFTETSLRHVQCFKIIVSGHQSPDTLVQQIAYLANENYTLKRLELSFHFDSYCWETLAHVHGYRSVVNELTPSTKIVDSIAAMKVLHNIDITITDRYSQKDIFTPADVFEPLIQAIATARGWSRDEGMYICNNGKLQAEKQRWAWHLWPPSTEPS